VIQRNGNVGKVGFTVGLNIVLEGSKSMTHEQQDALMQVAEIRVLITSADGKQVLVDEVVPAKEFSTGSVGYGLQVKNCQFNE